MIKPIRKNIVCVRLKKKTETASGIILNSDYDGNVDRAQVIDVGPEVTNVKKDDIVFIDWNKAVPVVVDDIPYYVIKEEFVIWVFEE